MLANPVLAPPSMLQLWRGGAATEAIADKWILLINCQLVTYWPIWILWTDKYFISQLCLHHWPIRIIVWYTQYGLSSSHRASGIHFMIYLTMGLSQRGFCYHSTKIPPFGDSKLDIGTESTLATLGHMLIYWHYWGIRGPLNPLSVGPIRLIIGWCFVEFSPNLCLIFKMADGTLCCWGELGRMRDSWHPVSVKGWDS